MVFDYIIEKILEKETSNFLLDVFLSRLRANNYFIDFKKMESKYGVLEDFIFNKKINDTDKEKILNVFSNAQKTYFGFEKLRRIFILKRAKPFESPRDLHFNDLSDFNNNLKMTLLDGRVRYDFKLADLICIINHSLLYSPNFFSSPKKIKNPYTNVAFSLSNLYNIYFTIKKSSFIMPTLLHRFFLSNFDLQKFSEQNEVIIREFAITNYLTSSSVYDLHEDIIMMLYNHNLVNTEKININLNFPKERLQKVFIPFLKFYINKKYSLDSFTRWINQRKLKSKLIQFSKDNPSFGLKRKYQNIYNLHSLSKLKESPNITFGLEKIPPLNMIDLENKCFYIDKVKGEYKEYCIFPSRKIEDQILNERQARLQVLMEDEDETIPIALTGWSTDSPDNDIIEEVILTEQQEEPIGLYQEIVSNIMHSIDIPDHVNTSSIHSDETERTEGTPLLLDVLDTPDTPNTLDSSEINAHINQYIEDEDDVNNELDEEDLEDELDEDVAAEIEIDTMVEEYLSHSSDNCSIPDTNSDDSDSDSEL